MGIGTLKRIALIKQLHSAAFTLKLKVTYFCVLP